MKKIGKRGVVKFGLDLVLLILLILLYKKNLISLMFHEVAGLCIMGLFLIHVLLNRKWVGAVSRRIFDHSLPGRTRFLYIVDVLIAISFIACGVTGIMISKIVFPFHITGILIPMHFFFAALSIVLTGIHFGLHLQMIGNIFSLKIPRVIIALIAVIIIACGAYNFMNSSMPMWFASPFSSGQMSGSGAGGHDENHMSEKMEGMKERPRDGRGNGNGFGQGNGKGKGNGSGNGMHKMSAGNNFSFLGLLQMIWMYGSILLGISALTAAAEKGIGKDSKEKRK